MYYFNADTQKHRHTDTHTDKMAFVPWLCVFIIIPLFVPSVHTLYNANNNVPYRASTISYIVQPCCSNIYICALKLSALLCANFVLKLDDKVAKSVEKWGKVAKKSGEKWLKKVGNSGEKWGIVVKSWKRWEKVSKTGENWRKVGKSGKSGEKCGKVAKSWKK